MQELGRPQIDTAPSCRVEGGASTTSEESIYQVPDKAGKWTAVFP